VLRAEPIRMPSLFASFPIVWQLEKVTEIIRNVTQNDISQKNHQLLIDEAADEALWLPKKWRKQFPTSKEWRKAVY
jgi:hypothetical protein